MEKPEIDFVDPEPPTDLVITDLTVGDGAEAASGQNVSVHYVGVAHSTGEEFDASYNRGEPLKFRLGIGQVIQGWDQRRAGHEGRRAPPARDPAAPGLRGPRRRWRRSSRARRWCSWSTCSSVG